MTETKIIADGASTAVKVTEAAVKRAWSLMDAAAEKRPPSEVLSPQAIKAVQGVADPSGGN